MVLENTPFKTIKDLKNKRIGFSSGGVNSIILKTMLEHDGLSESDVDIINVHYDLSQALLSHNIDAVTGLMRTFEVIQMEMNKHPVRIFLPEENGIPHYSVLIFVSRLDRAQDPRFSRFLSAIKKATVWLNKHQDTGWEMFAKNYPEAKQREDI